MTPSTKMPPLRRIRYIVLLLATALLILALTLFNGTATSADFQHTAGNQSVESLLPDWEQSVRARLANDAQLRALANGHPLVILHSRRFALGGHYNKSAYSFTRETHDEKKHDGDVQILFDNGQGDKSFSVNMAVDQANLIADLGNWEFSRNPDPSKVNLDDWLPGHAEALDGHVYLERIMDKRGNRFYVLLKVVTVDKEGRYVAFLWRALPGGRIVKSTG